MVSGIDSARPADGVAASKAELRSDIQAATDVIEALRARMADLQGPVLVAPERQGYSETSATAATGAGALDLNLATGNVFEVPLTEDAGSVRFARALDSARAGSRILILEQDGARERAVAWLEALKWGGGEAQALISAANAVGVCAAIKKGDGATCYGSPAGRGFS